MTAKEYLMQAYRLNELIDSDVEELEHQEIWLEESPVRTLMSVYRVPKTMTRHS